uniref:Putative secreted protein n=1 Tax=Ixodes ricinus TaxID=34613 RepID=A0A090XAZ6_IXORI
MNAFYRSSSFYAFLLTTLVITVSSELMENEAASEANPNAVGTPCSDSNNCGPALVLSGYCRRRHGRHEVARKNLKILQSALIIRGRRKKVVL